MKVETGKVYKIFGNKQMLVRGLWGLSVRLYGAVRGV